MPALTALSSDLAMVVRALTEEVVGLQMDLTEAREIIARQAQSVCAREAENAVLRTSLDDALADNERLFETYKKLLADYEQIFATAAHAGRRGS